jgi:hypothetical protein
MRAGWLNRDGLIAAGLFVASATYLAVAWPHNMVGQDEGEILYGAKRVFDGQVMYRDFFDQIGPLAPHVLALVYGLFGVSMETARTSLAVLHGAIVVLMYAIARQLGVRPMLAVLVGLTDIALFQPALSFTSPHWLATLLTLIVFCYVLRGPVNRNGRAIVAGALTGLVGLTQQPKGAGTAFAVAIVLVRDVWADRVDRGRRVGIAARRLAAFTLGILAVVVTTLGVFVWLAGFDPVYDALVLTPLVAYREFPFHSEGRWLIFTLTWPLLVELVAGVSAGLMLNLMPLIIPLSAARLVRQAVRGRHPEERRLLFVAVVFSAFSIASVYYQPNSFHFAVVGPIWLSLFGELLERVVQRLEATVRVGWAAPVVAATLLILLTLQLRRAYASVWATSGVPVDTAFGRVHLRSQALADEFTTLRSALQTAGAKDVLVYPTLPGLYLMTQTSNPTRFQILIPGYTTPEKFAEVQETLERERVPFVVRSFWFWQQIEDPLLPYLNEHYQQVRLQRPPGSLPSLTLLRRKADQNGAPTR